MGPAINGRGCRSQLARQQSPRHRNIASQGAANRALRLSEPSAIPATVSFRARAVLLLTGLSLLAACTAKHKTAEPLPPNWLKNFPVTPLEISEWRTAEAEGEHALFLRLSRFPDRINYTAQAEPPEIVIQMDGPAAGDDIPEERVIVPDSEINAMRISRKAGALSVVVEVAGPDLPPYFVDEAADWVTVRVRPAQPH